MGKTITVTFEKDIPEEQLEILREKIRKVIAGQAVPEDEVVGQWDPGASSTGAGALSLGPGDKIHGPIDPGVR